MRNCSEGRSLQITNLIYSSHLAETIWEKAYGSSGCMLKTVRPPTEFIEPGVEVMVYTSVAETFRIRQLVYCTLSIPSFKMF